jgi:hypothetical protein
MVETYIVAPSRLRKVLSRSGNGLGKCLLHVFVVLDFEPERYLSDSYSLTRVIISLYVLNLYYFFRITREEREVGGDTQGNKLAETANTKDTRHLNCHFILLFSSLLLVDLQSFDLPVSYLTSIRLGET